MANSAQGQGPNHTNSVILSSSHPVQVVVSYDHSPGQGPAGGARVTRHGSATAPGSGAAGFFNFKVIDIKFAESTPPPSNPSSGPASTTNKSPSKKDQPDQSGKRSWKERSKDFGNKMIKSFKRNNGNGDNNNPNNNNNKV